jgi:2-succinyl-5-enolpyruvyl-6-hydroxy-3-cyclohexene-1-carboxylate synthase
MTNIRAAHELLRSVRERGVRDFSVCAGSRNSPLLAVLGTESATSPALDDRLHVVSFVDERSASFFALGRIKLLGRPAAVVTTSGTAVAELLPATIEAYYSGLPLILITADRPARYRGTGAPQTIDQLGIFGRYATTELASWRADGPLHLNIEFDEPLIDEPLQPAEAR